MVKKKRPSPDSREAFGIDHVFSCEIEPYKQAYIARNFEPSILFRDLCEIAYDDKASTVYGAGKEVPRALDFAIAGTVCTDYSRLNKNAGTIQDRGESASTFDVSPFFWVTTEHRSLRAIYSGSSVGSKAPLSRQ